MKKTFLLSCVTVVVTALSCMAQTDRMMGDGISSQCLASANAAAAQSKAQGKSASEVERQLQSALAQCSGLRADVAMLAGTVNVDYTRFAKLVATDKISPNLYLGLVRDRSRKLRLARKNSIWLSAYAHGDADGDLVPDSLDRCPKTADLTPTDDNGCPTTEPLPAAPNIRDIHTALDGLGFITSPVCDGSQVPGVPAPLKAGYDNLDRSTFRFAVTKVSGQTQGCLVLYEVQIRFSQPTSALPPPEFTAQVVFRNTENTDNSSSGLVRQVFQLSASDTGIRKQIFDNAKYYNQKEIRVRAVNGNGLASSWSGILEYDNPSFQEPRPVN